MQNEILLVRVKGRLHERDGRRDVPNRSAHPSSVNRGLDKRIAAGQRARASRTGAGEPQPSGVQWIPSVRIVKDC